MTECNRPNVCKGYPWYNMEVSKKDPYLPLDCSFWEDVAVEIRPRQVKIDS